MTMNDEGLVVTVDGVCPKDDLKVVLAGEHLFTVTSEFHKPLGDDVLLSDCPISPSVVASVRRHPRANARNLVLDDVETMVDEMRFAMKHGLTTVVDLTTHDSGRNPDSLLRLAKATGLHVIMACGSGSCGMVPVGLRPQMPAGRQVDDYSSEFISELNEGVTSKDSPNSKIRAGVIAVGLTAWTNAEQTLLKGAAKAQIVTKAPIFLRVPAPTFDADLSRNIALSALQCLTAENAILSRVVICSNAGMLKFQEYQEMMMTSGVSLLFDATGPWADICYREGSRRLERCSDDQSAEHIAKLCGKFPKRVFVSHNICMKIMLRAHGGLGYAHALSTLVEYLQDSGMDAAGVADLYRSPASLLGWWIPPPEVEQEKATWTCDNCEKEFEEGKPKFEKFNYSYCSIKCLQEHQKKLDSGEKSHPEGQWSSNKRQSTAPTTGSWGVRF